MKKYNTVNQKPITHEEAERYVNLIESGMKGYEAVAIIRPDCKWPKDIAYAWSKTNKKVQAAFKKRYPCNEIEIEIGKRVCVYSDEMKTWIAGDIISNHKGYVHIYSDKYQKVITIDPKYKERITDNLDSVFSSLIEIRVKHMYHDFMRCSEPDFHVVTLCWIDGFKTVLKEVYGDNYRDYL